MCCGRVQGLVQLRLQLAEMTSWCLQILVMRNGRMESKEETETSPLPGMWPQLPITRCCETVVVSNVDSDARSAY